MLFWNFICALATLSYSSGGSTGQGAVTPVLSSTTPHSRQPGHRRVLLHLLRTVLIPVLVPPSVQRNAQGTVHSQ